MADGWGIAAFEPLTQLTFRPPRPFDAGVHGPSAAGSTYSYPPPSTIAGLLAGIAYRRSLCTGSPGQHEFDDVRECLANLLGGGFLLRPGLVLHGNRLYAYIGTDRLVLLDSLKEALARINPRGTGGQAAGRLERSLKEAPKLYVRRTAKYGIGLNRDSKSVTRRLLYRLDRVAYPPGSSIVVYTTPPAHLEPMVAKVGSKQGLVAVKALDGDQLPPGPAEALVGGCSGECDWALMLLTPALLDPDRGRLPDHARGAVIANNAEWAKGLAARLVSASAGECSGAEATLLVVPRNEWSLAVQTTGWSLSQHRPRKPMLVVPPGTLMLLIGATRECAARLAENGVGDHSNLGWGTIVATPLREGQGQAR